MSARESIFSTTGIALRLLGWHLEVELPPDLKSPEEFKEKPCILLLSHTSVFYDAFYYTLFMFASPKMREMKPLVVTIGTFPSPFLKDYLNHYSIPDCKRRGKSVTEDVCERARRDGNRAIIIDPSGWAEGPGKWRTGWYHIARKMGWGIRVCGFDFYKKKLVIGPYYPAPTPIGELSEEGVKAEIDSMELEFKDEMSMIVPYQPKNYPHHCRDFPKDRNTGIDTERVLLITTIIVFTVWIIFWILFLVIGSGFIIWKIK